MNLNILMYEVQFGKRRNYIKLEKNKEINKIKWKYYLEFIRKD